MVEVQKDPMEPAKFKINQKIPGPPPSPPAPVMHSPPRKITADEQKKSGRSHLVFLAGRILADTPCLSISAVHLMVKMEPLPSLSIPSLLSYQKLFTYLPSSIEKR